MNKQKFLASIKGDSPVLKLYKFRFLISNPENKELSGILLKQMLDIALENGLFFTYKIIYDQMKIGGELDPRYQPLREKFVQESGPFYMMEKQYASQNNYEKLADAVFKNAQLHFKHGDYKEASVLFTKLSNLNPKNHNIESKDYHMQYALCFYYENDFSQLTRFNLKSAEKGSLRNMVDMCLLRDVNDIFQRKNTNKPFKNIFDNEITQSQLTKNRVMSITDLGFLYSLLSMAYKKNQQIQSIKWTSKLENNLVNNNYKFVLQTLENQRQSRCCLPIINRVYNKLHGIIKRRIFVQVVSSFDRCPFTLFEQMTGINESELKRFSKQNADLPFLFDPITQSIAIRQNDAQLYQQVCRLYRTLKAEFDSEKTSLLRNQHSEKNQFQLNLLSRIGRNKNYHF